MPLLSDIVADGEGIVFQGRPSAAFICSPDIILLPRYLMNAVNNFVKTIREYSIAPNG